MKKSKKDCTLKGVSRIINTRYWQCNACKKKFDNLYDVEIHLGIEKPLNKPSKMTKTKKEILKEFDKKFYVFDREHNYELEFKAGNFTGSVNAFNLGRKIKAFFSQALDQAEQRGRGEVIQEITDSLRALKSREKAFRQGINDGYAGEVMVSVLDKAIKIINEK